MRRLLLFLLLLIPFVSKAQNYVQAGPSVYPMGSWGAEIVGDFKVADITPKLSFGIGVMAFASSGKTHDEPTPDQTVVNEPSHCFRDLFHRSTAYSMQIKNIYVVNLKPVE